MIWPGAFFELCCLPFDACFTLDAIVRTAARVLYTRRKLLEWQTSSEAERQTRGTLGGFYLSMWFSPVAALPLWSPSASRNRRTGCFRYCWARYGCWRPAISWFLSRPIQERRPELNPDDLSLLGKAARRTWRYFETFVVAPDNYLPPDNFQEHPAHATAHRTSPTNIGFALAANLSAYDFGYISLAQLLERTGNTLATLDKLERFRGQFYNWYDTAHARAPGPKVRVVRGQREPLGHAVDAAIGADGIAGSQDSAGANVSRAAGHAAGPDRGARGGTPRVFGRPRVPAPHEAVARLEGLAGELRGMVNRHGLDAPGGRPLLASSHTFLQRLALAGTQFAVFNDDHVDPELKWWARAFERQVREASENLSTIAPWVMLPPASEFMWRRGTAQQVHRLSELRNLLRQLEEIPTYGEAARIESQVKPMIDAIRKDLENREATRRPRRGIGWAGSRRL